jgi:hypothetical protein
MGVTNFFLKNKRDEMTYDSNPLLKPADEPDLGDLHALLAAATAAKQIITWTKKSPAAAWTLFFLDGNKYLIDGCPLRVTLQESGGSHLLASGHLGHGHGRESMLGSIPLYL